MCPTVGKHWPEPQTNRGLGSALQLCSFVTSGPSLVTRKVKGIRESEFPSSFKIDSEMSKILSFSYKMDLTNANVGKSDLLHLI